MENSGACEIHGGLGIPLPEVSVFLWDIFENSKRETVVIMGSDQL